MKKINSLINNGYTFDYGWRKNEKIIFLDREMELEIVFDAYFKEDEIKEEQFKAYSNIKDNLNNIIKNNIDPVMEYLSKISNNKMITLNDITDVLKPRQLIITDSYIGIYCESELDIDNGIAIKIVNNAIEVVGEGDIIL